MVLSAVVRCFVVVVAPETFCDLKNIDTSVPNHSLNTRIQALQDCLLNKIKIKYNLKILSFKCQVESAAQEI